MSTKVTYICDLCRSEWVYNPMYGRCDQLAPVSIEVPTGIPGGRWQFDACPSCRTILADQIRLALNALTIGPPAGSVFAAASDDPH